MRGINVVWNMCIIKCITNRCNYNKGGVALGEMKKKSPNDGNLRDSVCLNPLN